ncbi:MAG: EAL domain-containing protein, partial [Myxococcales bacterium]|nr:EAL domain-containing protein [Myxococcales bacterium]
VLANRALGALLGSEPADLVGLALADMPPVEARVRVLEGFARATRGLHPGPARGMVLRRRDDGRPVRVDIQHRPVVVGGRPLILGLFAEVDEPAEAASEPFAAHHDPVTGLLNSAGFEQTCAARLHAAPERRFNLVRFDLDRFDELSLSDPTLGGELLRRVGERLQGLCPTCPAARVDGDEFLILQPADEAVDPLTQATRLLDSVFDEPIALSGNPIPLTAAAAVTRVGLHAGLDRATQRALRATLDEARLAHGPRIVAVGDATTSGGMTNKVATIAGGIVRREFVLHYQPKVRLDRDQVVGVEALVRWQHPDRGLLLPGQFLPDIAGTRLMRTLGEQLIEQTLDQMVAWARAGTPQAVAMNVSGDQLADHGFVRRLQEGLRGRPELDPRALQVEVLESSALDLRGPVVGHLHTLAQMGIGLAIDDFGTGYSSLALLQSLPVRTVKIDRSFVLALTTDVRQAVIVDGVLGMARGLMRQVVAEGVETETHGVRLIQLGCTTGQGFAIAHALPADALAAWARGWRRPAAWQTARAVARSRLRRLVLGWDHDIWRRAVLERLSMPPSAGLGDALPPSLFAEWRPTFRPSPELDALCAEHTHLRAQADALLATRPHPAELSPELRTFHAAAARFAARLAQTPALVEVDEPGEAGPNPWDTPAP